MKVNIVRKRKACLSIKKESTRCELHYGNVTIEQVQKSNCLHMLVNADEVLGLFFNIIFGSRHPVYFEAS